MNSLTTEPEAEGVGLKYMGGAMTNQGQAEALHAIREEAEKLLDYDLRKEIVEGLRITD